MNNNRNDKGDIFTAVYGLESLPMERLELIDGEIDREKLLSGNYILEGVLLDDNGRAEMETASYQVGDHVTLHNWYAADPLKPEERDYTEHQYTVLGHVAVKSYTNSDRSYWGYIFYLPSEVYLTIMDTPAVMSYAFNVADSQEADAEAFLQTYTQDVEPMMNYDSKSTVKATFADLRNTVLLIGGALSGIIGLIGILNFINAVLTSILARRKEFAMLQSVGMTRGQLIKMLCFEGSFYAVFSGVSAITLGMIFSLVVAQTICKQMWFLSYHMMVWPLLAAIPVLLVLGVLVPVILYGMTDRASIVERLREAE